RAPGAGARGTFRAAGGRRASDVVALGAVAGEVLRIAEPVDGAREAALEAFAPAVGRAPIEQALRLGRVREQPLDFGILRPDALLLGDHADVAAHHLGDELRGVAH